jgi:hypothetical protein
MSATFHTRDVVVAWPVAERSATGQLAALVQQVRLPARLRAASHPALGTPGERRPATAVRCR